MTKPAPRTSHESDLQVLNAGVPTEYTDGSLGVVTPTDMPVYLRAFTLMQDTPDHRPPAVTSRALKGWTLQVDAFTFGVSLFIRIGMDGTLKVFAQDNDGTTKLEEWQK